MGEEGVSRMDGKLECRQLDEETIEVNLPSKMGYERMAMDCTASFAKIAGFRRERIDDLRTAVAEACINAIEHGNRKHPGARVLVTMNFKDGAFSVTVKDKGDGIGELPSEAVIKAEVEELDIRSGLGTYLIRKLVDQVDFNETTIDGHTVKMVIKLDASGEKE
jgi:serine/threonine-protein kinase RsbW